MLSVQHALEGIGATVRLEAPRSARGLAPCRVCGVAKVGHDGARFIEKADDITLVGVGGLGDFSQPPEAVEGVELK